MSPYFERTILIRDCNEAARLPPLTRTEILSVLRRAVLLMSTIAAATAATCGIALAAPHVLDPTFDGDGKVATRFSTGKARAVALQPDGKIVVAGTLYVGEEPGAQDIGVLRYNADGSLDTSFSGDGALSFSFNSGNDWDYATDIAVKDGNIIVVGSSTATGNALEDEFAVARLDSHGTFDTSFGGGDGKVTTAFVEGVEAKAYSVALLDNGKIAVAGDAHTGAEANVASNFAVARYNADGTLDTSFGGGDGKVMTGFGPCPSQTWGRGVAVQPDGKLVVTGMQWNLASQCVTPNTNPDETNVALVRYNADGSLDYGFGNGGVVMTKFLDSNGNLGRNEGGQVEILPDGKILVGGDSPGFLLARYNADGSLDTTFDNDGKKRVLFGTEDDYHDFGGIAVTPGGRIVIAGTYNETDNDAAVDTVALGRLNSDGSMDDRFSGDGRHTQQLVPGDPAEADGGIVLQPDGKMVVAGGHEVWNPDTQRYRYFFALLRFKGGSEGPSGGLMMTSSSPVPNGSLKYTKDIAVSFSGPVDRDTVKPATSASAPNPDADDYTVGLFLEKKNSQGHIYYTNVPAKLEYAPSDPNKLIVDPKRRLYPKKRYVLMLQGGESGLMDTDGATLVDDLPIFFKAKR